MSEKELPMVSYTAAETVPENTAIFDRDANLIVVNLDKPNDYSGEFINSGRICISLDSKMMIEDLEVKFSTSDVEVDDGLSFPEGIVSSVVFEDSYISVERDDVIRTTNSREVVHILFEEAAEEEILHLKVAEGIIFDVSLDNRLMGIWLNQIILR